MNRPLLMVWLLLALVGAFAVNPVHGPASTHLAQILAAASWGLVVTLGARTALFLRAARSGELVLQENAPPWRMWHLTVAALPVGLVSAAITAAIVFGLRMVTPRGVFVFGIPLGTFFSLIVTQRAFAGDIARPRAPRHSQLWKWILLDTALPAAMVTAPVSAGFAYLRLYGPAVAPTALARHLALTLTLYGVCLGMVGFIKTYTERQIGLVTIEQPPQQVPRAPGPFAVAALCGIAVLLIGPHIFPTLTGPQAVIFKALFGFFGGGTFAALGALKGAGRQSPDAQ